MRKPLLVAAAVVLAAAAATGLLRLRGAGRRDAALRDVPVESRTVGRTLVEYGWLVSVDSAPVRIGATGEITEIATNGKAVTEGDVVIRIDDANARERLEENEFWITGANRDIEASKANYDYTDLAQSNRIMSLKNDLVLAELEYEDARRGLKPEDRRLLKIELALARLDREEAEEELAKQRRLHEKGFVSKLIVERHERYTATARAGVEEVEARIRLEEKGVSPERLLELEKEMERLRGLVERGEREKERALEAVLGWRRVTEAHLDRSRHTRERTLEELAGAEVRAPASGVFSVRVHYTGQGRGFTEYKTGEMRYKSEILADVVNPGRMKVELMVHEADAARIDPDMPARIRLPAFPDREFRGRVTEIGRVGRDRADVAPSGYEVGRSGVTMFNATVSLDTDEVEFHPGMSALVEIEIEPPIPRLVVPRAAVTVTENGIAVRLKTDGGYRLTPVTGRPLGDDFFMVGEGLRETDRVGIPAGRNGD